MALVNNKTLQLLRILLAKLTINKFIYFIIKAIHPIDQTELMRISELPRRTIQVSISELKWQGVIIENVDPHDSRKKII